MPNRGRQAVHRSGSVLHGRDGGAGGGEGGDGGTQCTNSSQPMHLEGRTPPTPNKGKHAPQSDVIVLQSASAGDAGSGDRSGGVRGGRGDRGGDGGTDGGSGVGGGHDGSGDTGGRGESGGDGGGEGAQCPYPSHPSHGAGCVPPKQLSQCAGNSLQSSGGGGEGAGTIAISTAFSILGMASTWMPSCLYATLASDSAALSASEALLFDVSSSESIVTSMLTKPMLTLAEVMVTLTLLMATPAMRATSVLMPCMRTSL